MPPTDPDKIADLAQALLDSVVGELVDPPDRRFRTVGERPATVDCSQVAVRLVSGNRGLAGREIVDRVMCADTWSATFSVEVWRDCWPVQDGVSPPDDSLIDEQAAIRMRDAWCLMQGVHRATNAQEWKDACEDTTLGRLTMTGPEGGYAGAALEVTAELL